MMPSSPISVTLSIANGTWQTTLPQTLLQAGMLRYLLRFTPDLEVSQPNRAGSLEVVKRYNFNLARQAVWSLWTRSPGKKHSRLPVMANAWLADRLASKWAGTGSVFHGWTATSLASLRTAKQAQVATLLEHPMLHPLSWQREVLTECHRHEIDPADCASVLPEQLIVRMEREFAECDKIVVPSRAAHRSFHPYHYAAKAVVISPGVDHHLFAPAFEKSLDPLFRVCCVGRVELAKGIAYLLQAWGKIALPKAELVLIGETRDETKRLLERYGSANVRLTGPASPQEVAAWYRQSNAFVFPSVNEGFGMVLLEAMASGLPVIASKGTGADDCVTHGKDGFIFPARNTEALAELLARCHQQPHQAKSVGKNARAKIEAEFTLAHYDRRIMDLYKSVVHKQNERQVSGDFTRSRPSLDTAPATPYPAGSR
jgi:glycosyltransferase involved in cell wall biosynthesis